MVEHLGEKDPRDEDSLSRTTLCAQLLRKSIFDSVSLIMAKTNISVHNTSHGKMITLESVNFKKRTYLLKIKVVMFIWVSKQLLWFTSWHTICVCIMLGRLCN